MSDQGLDVAGLFRELFLADLEGSGDRGLDDYLRLFPGHEEMIAELHDRMSLGDQTGERAARATIGLDTSPGALVAHYRIVGEIGHGGQAVVLRAEDEKLGRPVALKLLLGAAQRGEAGLRRFRREAEVCSRLDHAGICTVHDTGIQGGIPYIVMELIEGLNLCDWARGRDSSTQVEASEFHFSDDLPDPAEERGRSSSGRPAGDLPDRRRIEAIVEAFIRAGQALDAAHAAGVIHRDIKPSNIMIKKDGQPVLLDFGLAQDLDSEIHALTQTGDFFGTPAYMSPEQISAHRIRLDLRSDIFSLGVSLYECLTATRPFDAPTREGIYQAILTKEARDPRTINRSVSRDLAVVVAKALEKDRDRRYQTAGEFAADLGRVLRFEPIQARPAGPGLRLLRWGQRNPAMAAAIAALPIVVLVTLLIAGFVEQGREARRLEAERSDHRAALGRDLDELSAMVSRNDMRLLLQPRILRRIEAHIAALGGEGRELVRARLDAESDETRLGAVTTLVHIGDVDSLDALIRTCLEDENKMVQMWSSQALMRMDGEGVNAALLRIFRESTNDACRVNSLWGLVFNEHPGAAELALDFVRDEEQGAYMRVVLAKNLLYLARAELDPVADWMMATLQPVQIEEWNVLIHHHQTLGRERNLEALRRIAAMEELDERTRESATKAVAETLEARGLDSVD